MSADGATIVASGPEELARVIEADITRWGEVIRKTGLASDRPR